MQSIPLEKCAAVLATLMAVTPAWAINKCTGADGKVVFQDAPCAGRGEQLDVRPAAGYSASPAPAAGLPGAKPMTEAQRIEKQIAESQKDRRRRDLQERLVPGAQDALAQHRADCERRQKELAADQYAYRQNLYGKTHAAQMASEMAAAAAICDTKERELKENLDALRSECKTLDGCR